MKRAVGEKVKDNPTLLKKTLKRKQKSKEKSSVAWYVEHSFVVLYIGSVSNS